MNKILDTVLLLALPASGKSEVRRYLELMPDNVRRRDFHMGDSVQLDDYPYVHMMRRIDDELESLGQPRAFFRSGSDPFLDARDWGTLIQLVNEDYEQLVNGARPTPASYAHDLFDRIDRAAEKAGAPARLAKVEAGAFAKLAEKLEIESRKVFEDLVAALPDTLEGKTLVIEFARGGPQGSPLPLPGAFGYRHSLPQLAPALLEKAAILYIWVTPEESRRKNEARTDPNDPGSILNHGVPHSVMINDYGTDDMDYLASQAERPGTLTVQAHGRTYHLPMARFDNRVDKTSFLRGAQNEWKPEQVEAVHEGLHKALEHLATAAVEPAAR